MRKQQGDTILIFITGIKDYVFDALDLYAFQYLLKPPFQFIHRRIDFYGLPYSVYPYLLCPALNIQDF